MVAFGHHPHPLRTGSRLAEAAPRHDQPNSPVAFRRQLRGPRPHRPVREDNVALTLIELVGKLPGKPVHIVA
ncbi:hypothetical protein IP83_12195 [Novosphingobium sp. AAP93]|nr:hypothetical protein IP83_12195 [Novosphingobium sp. AAP93]